VPIGRLDTRFDRIDARSDHVVACFDAIATRLGANRDRHVS
jgi:hypothetical protein